MNTERLHIRVATEEDRSRFVDLFSHAGFMMFSRTGALDRVAANLRFDHMIALGEELPFCKQCIIEESTGVIIGYAGADCFEFRGERRLEFGYRLIAESRGCGYATEAGGVLLDLARVVWSGELLAFIDPRNDASRNVLRKLDFEFLEHSSIDGQEVELYSITL
jgi:RimJ/RimL family protein N-acetyltransferase